jgi:RimJ/RimL family protein N-acetyltransferase
MALRPFALSDAAAIAEACRDPEIPRWTFMSDGLTVPQAREWIERAHDMLTRARAVRLAIVDANDGTFHGQIGVGRLDWEQQRGEIFYWLAASARGRGIATAAVRALTPWAFEVLNLARIEIIVDPGNPASQRVAAAAGYEREGVLRSYQWFKDRRMDAVMFSRLPTDS